MDGDKELGGDETQDAVDLGIPGFRGAVEVGRGGFGIVYRAYQPKLNRTVAIKILSGAGIDTKTKERFERELTAMGTLSAQPNIMTVYDAGFTEFGHPYIVMEYTPAGSLAEVMATRGAFSAQETVSIGARMAEALASAHAASILHRDLKPENIMVSPYGEPLLSDFGIARMMSGPATRTGSVTASLDHAAPEVLEGKKPTEASDIYSLASSLYGLVAGIAPFRKDTDESLAPMITRIMTTDVAALDEAVIPAAIFAELKRAMSKDPKERHGSASQFADALRSAANASGLSLGPVVIDAPATRMTNADDSPDTADDASKTYIYQRIPRATDTEQSSDDDEKGPTATALAGQQQGEADEAPVGDEDVVRRKQKKPVTIAAAAVLVLFAGLAAVAAVRNGNDSEPAPPTVEGDWTDRSAALIAGAATTSTTTKEAPIEVVFDVKAGEPLVIAEESEMDITVTSEPEHGGVEIAPDGAITYTAESDYSGDDSFDYRSCDGEGDCKIFKATITVEGDNPAPTVEDDEAETTSPEQVIHSVLDNDSDDDGLDIESLTIINTPTNGTASVTDEGSIAYTPSPAFTGVDRVEYEVCDLAENPACARGTFTVTVNPALTAGNETDGSEDGGNSRQTTTTALAAPTANNDSKTTDEDKSASWDVTSNDSGQIDNWSIKSQPKNGTADKSGNNLSYTPKGDYNGSDSLIYEVCNETGCDTATVNITVKAVNDPPVALDSTYTTGRNRGWIRACVLQRASDVDGDDLTIKSVGNASPVGTSSIGGSVSGEADCDESVRLDFPDKWTGVVTIPYTISDSNGGTDGATLTVTIVNNPPLAADDDFGTVEDNNGSDATTWTFREVLCNDSDPDGDTIQIVSATASVGSVSIGSGDSSCEPKTNNLLIWDAGSYVGSVTFNYTISDGDTTDSATVSFSSE